MTRREFEAAISRLTVQSGPDGFVIARPIYSEASGAFNRAGAAGWLWFTKRAGEPLDEGAARAEFLSWLKAASEEEIGRFVDAAPTYRAAFCKAAAGAKEKIKSGEGALDWWRQTEHLAGYMATETRQKSRAGKNSAKARGDPVKIEALRLAERAMSKRDWPSRSSLAGKISRQLDEEMQIARSQDRIDAILEEAGILTPAAPRVSKAARNLVRPLGLPSAEEETASRMIVALREHVLDVSLDHRDVRTAAYGRDRIKGANERLDALVLALEKDRRGNVF
jgi:hypothetical protein